MWDYVLEYTPMVVNGTHVNRTTFTGDGTTRGYQLLIKGQLILFLKLTELIIRFVL
jgi:hypothetical protein